MKLRALTSRISKSRETCKVAFQRPGPASDDGATVAVLSEDGATVVPQDAVAGDEPQDEASVPLEAGGLATGVLLVIRIDIDLAGSEVVAFIFRRALKRQKAMQTCKGKSNDIHALTLRGDSVLYKTGMCIAFKTT